MRLDNDYRNKKKKTNLKSKHTWSLNQTFLNNEHVTEEVKEIETALERKNNENMMI